MDNETKQVVHMEVGDSREVERKATRMEKVVIQRGLGHLLDITKMSIVEVITDGSQSIIKLLSK